MLSLFYILTLDQLQLLRTVAKFSAHVYRSKVKQVQKRKCSEFWSKAFSNFLH